MIPFSEDTDTRIAELAKENSELRAKCSHAAKRAAIFEGIEEKNRALQTEISSLRGKLNASLDSNEDLQVKCDSLTLASVLSDSRHEFEMLKHRKTVDKANRELDEASRAYTNTNAENSLYLNKIERLEKEVNEGRVFVNSLKTDYPGFLAGIVGPSDLPDPSRSEEAKAEDDSRPRGREVFVKRNELNRHECSDFVWTARPLKCRLQKLRNWAARPLKASQRRVPDLEVRKDFEKSVKDFVEAVAADRYSWVLDWGRDEDGIRTRTYSHEEDVVRKNMFPVPNALAQTLSKWYDALDELVLGMMEAHGEDAQSYRADPPQCRATLATTPSKASKARKAKKAAVPTAEPMDIGQTEPALVSADSVDPNPGPSASVSAGDKDRTTAKVNTDT